MSEVVVTRPDPRTALMARLLRLLRWRVWVVEKLQPTEWQLTLAWAAVAGFLGALASQGFRRGADLIHHALTGSDSGIVDSFRALPVPVRVVLPAFGGLLAGAILLAGKRIAPGQSSTDYMEAILIGNGRVPVRSSLVKSTAALFSIASGGSIGREGPMVQLSAVLASWVGRWREFSRQRLRLLVACGAAAGIASAYNAPIAGSFFVAEIILGTIAMESLGPLVVAAVAATLTTRGLSDAHTLYQVPPFTLHSAWEMGPYIVLGMLAGTVAPLFLRSLRSAEHVFAQSGLPVMARLAVGGLIVGVLAAGVPEVCGNGYSVVVSILNGGLGWKMLLLVFACKWLATAASFGSGAPGGAFTPTLFMGASFGFLFGHAVHAIWPSAAIDPQPFALVGMGAFLSAATQAPVMAVIMLFEMTLSYDIILPLMLCAVIAYYAARGLSAGSLYSESLEKKAAAEPEPMRGPGAVRDLMKANPPAVKLTARFDEVARLFLDASFGNLYVVDDFGRFIGAVSLNDIKPYLSDPEIAAHVIASDLVREDFASVAPDQTLAEALRSFAQYDGQRLPVVEKVDTKLVGSLAKNDLLLAVAEQAQARHLTKS